MTGNDLIDHSPRQPEAVRRLENASRLVLIDNYDSFTWNGESSLSLYNRPGAHQNILIPRVIVYQYLVISEKIMLLFVEIDRIAGPRRRFGSGFQE